MASNPDLTTEQGLRDYLTAKNVEHSTVALLTGGSANYVYRVVLSDGQTVIYKHAAPYLHSNKTFALDPIRMDYEHRILEALPAVLRAQLPESTARPVGCNSYDQEAKLLCIVDGGERDLKNAYADQKLSIMNIGEELGRWIAALHECSTNVSVSLPDQHDVRANNQIAVAIYRHSYRNLSGALGDFGHDVELGKYIDDKFGSRLATDEECVCHGDFWPANVLVKIRDEAEKQVDLTVVDWELTRRGTSATDVGQFAAEAFLLDRFRGDRGLRCVFLNAYVVARKGVVRGEWIRRMAVHWAVHIAFWPTRVHWADREGTQKLVNIGVGVLRAIAEGDWDKLRASELFHEVDIDWSNCHLND